MLVVAVCRSGAIRVKELQMKKFIGLLGVALAISAPAFAADMPVPAPAYKAPPPLPVFSWTGWYIGGNAGYGWGSSTNPSIMTDPFDSLGFAGVVTPSGGNVFPSLTPKGFIGGGQIGYDWQVNPSWVLGLVTDFQGANIQASGTNNFSGITESLAERLDFLGTVRARSGLAVNNWLFYGSGGFAYGEVHSTINYNDPILTGATVSGAQSDTRVGWAAGGGVNYAVTSNWVVGVDYLHYDLGHTNVTGSTVPPGTIIPNAGLTASENVAGDIVRGVINYKF
jgi:outer membrane immunogenic protein